MKKILSLILVLVLGFTVCACNEKEITKNNNSSTEETAKPAKLLEGYFKFVWYDSAGKYKFEITDIASGDYGGECTNMNNTNYISSYYVVGNEVFIDGRLTYIYDDPYLICVNTETNLTINDNNQVEGEFSTNHNYDNAKAESKFTFHEDGNVYVRFYYNGNNNNNAVKKYTIEDNIITFEGISGEYHLIIHENKIYKYYERT